MKNKLRYIVGILSFLIVNEIMASSEVVTAMNIRLKCASIKQWENGKKVVTMRPDSTVKDLKTWIKNELGLAAPPATLILEAPPATPKELIDTEELADYAKIFPDPNSYILVLLELYTG